MVSNYSILVDESGANDPRYDTTIDVFYGDEKYEGFLSLTWNEQTDEELIKYTQKYYPEIPDNCKVIYGWK